MREAKSPERSRRAIAAALSLLLVAGCASVPRSADGPGDPLEPVNRRIHAFNDGVDRFIGRPVARAYDRVVPGPADRAVTNFFANLDDVSVLVNSGLQLKGRKFGVTAGRLTLNTTIGLLGLIDVAGKVGLEKENEDFGQTLGYWGLGPGPYLVLPLLGPSGLRDGTGWVVDLWYDPINEFDDSDTRIGLRVLQGVDTRAAMLGATEVADATAVDPYVFTREAYRSRRAHLVYDGQPPPEAVPEAGPGKGYGDFDPFGDEDDALFDDGAGEAAGD